MMRTSLFLAALAALSLAACSPPSPTVTHTAPPETTATTAAPSINGIPAGDYVNDKAHSSLIFRISHMGYSHFTGRFANWEAHLHFDPAHPEAATVTATIDPMSLETDNPPAGFLNDLRTNPQWLDAHHAPQITFHSTSVTMTGANTARVAGDFSLHGVTKPVTLDVTFNGGYPGMALDPHARIGFSARGALKRSDFGISYGLPPPGSNMGVGDEIEVVIESEFTGPAWQPPAQPQH